MENNNISSSVQKIVGPEILKGKRELKKAKEEKEKNKKIIEALIRYSDSLDW